jgi:hypothetical protein
LISGFLIQNFGIANNVIFASIVAFISVSLLCLKTDVTKIKAPE